MMACKRSLLGDNQASDSIWKRNLAEALADSKGAEDVLTLLKNECNKTITYLDGILRFSSTLLLLTPQVPSTANIEMSRSTPLLSSKASTLSSRDSLKSPAFLTRGSGFELSQTCRCEREKGGGERAEWRAG